MNPTGDQYLIHESDEVLIPNLSAGIYEVLVTDAKGCTNDCSVEVFQIEKEEKEVQICKGGEIPLGEAIGSGLCHLWNPQEGLEDPTSSQTIANPEETTLYTLTIMDDNGAVIREVDYLIEVEVGKLTIQPTNPSICQPATITLSCEEGYNNYIWTGPNGLVVGTTFEVLVSKPGIYEVTATEVDGCEYKGEIEVISDITVKITSKQELICDGQSLELKTGGGYQSYAWSNGDNGAEITITNPGTYSVTVTGTNGCIAEDEIEIGDADDIEQIKTEWGEKSDQCYPIKVVRDVGFIGRTGSTRSNSTIHDYAEKIIEIDGQEIAVEDLFTDYLSCDNNSSYELFITTNKSYCEEGNPVGNTIISQVEQEFINSTAEFVVWAHIWDDPDSDEDFLCLQYKGSEKCNEDPELLGPDWAPATYSHFYAEFLDYRLYLVDEQARRRPNDGNVIWEKNANKLLKLAIGDRLELAVLSSLGLDQNRSNYANGARPDSYLPVFYFPPCTSFGRDGIIIDVKTTEKPYIFLNQGIKDDKNSRYKQIPRYIEYLKNSAHGQKGVPGIWLITNAGVGVYKDLMEEATSNGIAVFHSEVYYNVHNKREIKVGRACMLNGPIFTAPSWSTYFPPRPYGLGLGYKGLLAIIQIDRLRNTAEINVSLPTP